MFKSIKIIQRSSSSLLLLLLLKKKIFFLFCFVFGFFWRGGGGGRVFWGRGVVVENLLLNEPSTQYKPFMDHARALLK